MPIIADQLAIIAIIACQRASEAKVRELHTQYPSLATNEYPTTGRALEDAARMVSDHSVSFVNRIWSYTHVEICHDALHTPHWQRKNIRHEVCLDQHPWTDQVPR